MGAGGLGSCGSPPPGRGAALLGSHYLPEVARPLLPWHVCLLRVKGSLARVPVGPARVPLSACSRSAPDLSEPQFLRTESESRSGPPEFSSKVSSRGFQLNQLFLRLPSLGPISFPIPTPWPISNQTRGTCHLHAPSFHIYFMPTLLQKISLSLLWQSFP